MIDRSNLPLIGLTGHKGVGKDTVGAVLVKEFGYVRRAFADALREELAEHLYLHQAASLEDYWVRRDAFFAYVEQHKRDAADTDTGWPRLLMQSWGQMRRDLFGADYWVKKLPLDSNVVITDVRYPNEAAAIHAAGGLVFRIVRNGYHGDNHISEQHIDQLPVDRTFLNNGSVENLREKIKQLMAARDTLLSEKALAELLAIAQETGTYD